MLRGGPGLLYKMRLTTKLNLQDPILRFGGMFAVGLAYRGTDNNAAIQRLLRYAVTDVSDDVRRAAVMNLGFVLLGVPDQCPAIVSQLARSYNAHLRYGAAMAVAIACAGTGMGPHTCNPAWIQACRRCLANMHILTWTFILVSRRVAQWRHVILLSARGWATAWQLCSSRI